MTIKKLTIKNFKRFTNLSISDIPDSSKLVLLIGSNGSGKSSIFDAFDWLGKGTYKPLPYKADESEEYYQKEKGKSPFVSVGFAGGVAIKKGNSEDEGLELAHKFIGRSSIRIVPRVLERANPEQVATDNDSPLTYIENDTRFVNDVYMYIQEVNNAVMGPIFKGQQPDTEKIFKNFIEPLNESLLTIFGGNRQTTIQISEFKDATPYYTKPANMIFEKGDFKIHYDLLSHGEKQVIILLINFIVRQEFYKDSIIFIDEMDCHLNTALQYNLLHEIVTKWIPDDSQLWTATHALGFIDYAKKSEKASIIDFDLLNFDTKQALFPLAKDNMDVYEVAIPKATITSILKGYKLVVVENQNDKHFNAALGEDGYLFLPANNSREVFLTVKRDKEKLGLRDRDYFREDEVEQIKKKMINYKFLSYYSFENYIYHPDNIAELKLKAFNKEEYIAEITKQKNEKLLDIVIGIGTSRLHYIEFKDCIKNDEKLKLITEALKSDDFETFYPYFNMKVYFSRNYLSAFNITITNLSQTKWFRTQILKVLKA